MPVPNGLGWRLGLAAPILLISVIGGRIIPSFTRHWLFKRHSDRLPAAHGAVDGAAVGLLCAGLILLGLSILGVGAPVASAIHALTAGGIAIMILAVMPRVTLGHTEHDLTANRATVAIFLLINAAAITRVCASWNPDY